MRLGLTFDRHNGPLGVRVETGKPLTGSDPNPATPEGVSNRKTDRERRCGVQRDADSRHQ